MNIDYSLLKSEISSHFPEISFIFAYGSAIFPQKNHDYSKNPPLIDLVFIVDDYLEFHKNNIKLNRNHYSGLAPFLGGTCLNALHHSFIPVHYNPFIKLPSFNIKYGVTSTSSLIRDLWTWENLVLPGRMQKPILFLKEDSPLFKDKLNEALYLNRLQALVCSILLNFNILMKEEDIYTSITSLSYVGDIRFTFGAEKKDKINNIADAQKIHFRKLYTEIIKKSSFKNDLIFDEGAELFDFNANSVTKRKLIGMLPYGIKRHFSVNEKDFIENADKWQIDELAKFINTSLKSINRNYSTRMVLYHGLTTSPIKNFIYVLNKFKKRFK